MQTLPTGDIVITVGGSVDSAFKSFNVRKLRNNIASGAEGGDAGRLGNGGAAVGNHVKLVIGIGSQAGDVHESVVSNGQRGVSGVRTGHSVVDFPRGGTTGFVPVQCGGGLVKVVGEQTVRLCAVVAAQTDVVDGSGQMAVAVKIPTVVVPIEDNLFGTTGHVVQDNVDMRPVAVVGGLYKNRGAGGGTAGRKVYACIHHIDREIVVCHPIAGLTYGTVVESQTVFNVVVCREVGGEDSVGVRNDVRVDIGGAAVRGDVDGVAGAGGVVFARQTGGGTINPLVRTGTLHGEY